MKKDLNEAIEIPQEINCTIDGSTVICKKDNIQFSRTMDFPNISVQRKGSQLVIYCKKGNKNEFKVIRSFAAHIKNMLKGLNTKFVYRLEACNLHFPITLKVEKEELLISNFLGEKVPRRAKILPQVAIEVKGQKITLSSHDKEAAGQTAANIEKATKIRFRDRRIFQDGIFITEKPEDQRQ